MSSILFGDTMVPIIELRLYPPLGYSTSYKEHCLTSGRVILHRSGFLCID